MEKEVPIVETKSVIYFISSGCQSSFAKKLFISAKFSNLQEYLELYPLTDILSLAEIFIDFRETVVLHHGLDPCMLTTLPSLAMECALKVSIKQGLALLTDIEVYTNFENGIRGGITSAVEGKVVFNTPSLPSFSPELPITSGLFVDVNSLYATILSGKLP